MKSKSKWLKLMATVIAMTMVIALVQTPLLADTTDSTEYTITWTQSFNDIPGLSAISIPSSGNAGQKEIIQFCLTKDITFNSITVNDTEITDYTIDENNVATTANTSWYIVAFTMPAENVEITINVTAPTYTVTLNACENGTAVIDKNSGKPGDTVNLTVTPDEGYEVKSILFEWTRPDGEVMVEEITDYYGNNETEYAFEIGNGDASITVTFGLEDDPALTSGIAHVQDIGNVTYYAEEEGLLYLGTEGEGKRLEAITLNFENPSEYSGTLEYRVHVQDIGWTEWVEAGNPAGTEGQAKRIEAIEIRLTGELADYYSVFYGVHIQDYGNMQGFVSDGALAGTTGESKRIEALTVCIVPKPSEDEDDYGPLKVEYRVHVQDLGWESKYAVDGEMAGTSGQSKRLEGIEIFLANNTYSGGIQYKTHIQDIGWESSWVKNGEMSGTQGQSKRLEGICIELYGEVADYYDIYYRVHAQDIGWMGWAKNGECAGTAGRSARLEGIQIVLVPKGDPAPGATYEGITAVTDQAFVEGF